MKKIPVEKEQRKKLMLSGFTFFACYLAVVLFVFLMIIILTNFKTFISDHMGEEISFCLSLFFLLSIVYLYFYYMDRELLYKVSNVVLFFTLALVSAVLCWLGGRYLSVYVRPYALFAILCFFLFGKRHALFLNFVFALLIFSLDLLLVRFSETIAFDTFGALLTGFVSGTLSVFSVSKVRSRLGVLGTGAIVAAATAVVVLFLKIPNIAEEGWIGYVSAAAYRVFGSLGSAVFAFAFLPLFEAVFNRLTVFRLRELTSSNAPLLARLQKEAPGTFNHSMIVAQLAEVCAVAIGEDGELARAAAYYHDVGKLKQPDCFTENQTDYNVHDELTPELSADIIRSHAKDGYELLTEAHLPQIIADVAREHHGTLPIKFFYNKAMKISGGDARIEDYSYLGPVPQSKVAAIIMIADASEAAARSMNDRSPEAVERVVRSIIEERMDLDQFAECDITIKQLTVIKQTLVDALSGVHHRRVKYPAIRFTRERKAVADEEDHE